MTIIATNPLYAFATAKDDAAIQTIIESVGSLADTSNFEALGKLYAPEVELDYTSLTGGAVELKSPKAIMTAWASVLPGFDQTRHAISNIKVSTNGKTASARADVVADHYVDDLFWQVKGSYMYRLQKDDNVWQITGHTFTLKSESGTRDVFGPATENAKRNPAVYIIRQQTLQVVENFISALESKNTEQLKRVFNEHAVLEVISHGTSTTVKGLEEILTYHREMSNVGTKSTAVLHPAKDAQVVFVEFNRDADIASQKQHVSSLFQVEDGKINLVRMYI